MTRPLPPIAPCPKGHKTVRVITNATGRMKRVDCCSCGWAGPLLDTERLAILAWNRRDTAEAERIVEELDTLRKRIAELEGARLHNCPVCEQPCDCRYPGAEGEDCECKNYHELEDRAVAAEEALADERETSREYAAELEHLRADHQELSDQFIANAQRLGSVCYSWHNWAVEIVGKEAARRMSGQDMRDEIARRLAGRTTDQAEPRKRRGPGPDGPPKAGDPQDADKDGDL